MQSLPPLQETTTLTGITSTDRINAGIQQVNNNSQTQHPQSQKTINGIA
ncbi:hypothetical protein [Planctopirus hydrillae]|nr:hypothetical protein [Planctopirus hydrillae]